MNILKKIKAFTLAEVLASLTIIGVISALTIPAVVHNSELRTNAALVRKAMNKLDIVMEQAISDDVFQSQVNCYYWKPGEDASKCTTTRNEDNPDGSHGGWTTTCADDNTSGMDNNGYFADCKDFYNYLVENMNTVKSCEQSFSEGCTPEYTGIDTNIARGQGESDEDYFNRIKYNSTGCSNWRANSIKTRPAFVTNDGMIFFAFAKTRPIFAVDVNGKKGPNKFGYDVFFFQAKGGLGQFPSFYPGGCEFTQKGGKSTAQMISGEF